LIDIIFQKNLLNLVIKKKIKFIARIKLTSNAVDKFNIYLKDQTIKINMEIDGMLKFILNILKKIHQ
jgi:hypothetical protein